MSVLPKPASVSTHVILLNGEWTPGPLSTSRLSTLLEVTLLLLTRLDSVVLCVPVDDMVWLLNPSHDLLALGPLSQESLETTATRSSLSVVLLDKLQTAITWLLGRLLASPEGSCPYSLVCTARMEVTSSTSSLRDLLPHPRSQRGCIKVEVDIMLRHSILLWKNSPSVQIVSILVSFNLIRT